MAMQNYTKRQLMELLEKLPEDSMIAFVAAYDIEEGDIVYPLGQFDGDHPNADCFFISVGDPDELADLQKIRNNVGPNLLNEPTDEQREGQAAYDDLWRR